MPLGQGIEELLEAVRDRIEVSGHDPTWLVTAGSFDSALAYARDRFEDPVVLARKDRDRWWPRVTITITTDPTLAAGAPPLEELAHPLIPAQQTRDGATDTLDIDEVHDVEGGAGDSDLRRRHDPLPSSLEAIFAHQEELRLARQRVPAHDSHAQVADSRSA